jgi:pimeloyl-ACP methyl ester carboxylesterase
MVIIDAGHFVWEEAPTEYTSALIRQRDLSHITYRDRFT